MDAEEIQIDIPKKKEYGDFSTNVAMKLAGRVNMSPKELGDKIRDRIITQFDFIKDISVMGPGFINFYIKEERLIKNSLESIENGDFKKFKPNNKNVKISIVLNKLSDILELQNFRAFMNMYYLGNLYSFAGYNVRKLVFIKENNIDLNIKYFLSNFKNIEIVSDHKEFQGSITFSSVFQQGMFKGLDDKRFIVEGVNIFQNGFIINDSTLSRLLEKVGIDRIKYTLCNKAINKEMSIELTNDELRYIQYPYSRIISIINILKDEGIDIDNIRDFDQGFLNTTFDKEIIKKITEFKDVIVESINQNQPYKFIKYANDLCEIFYKINGATLFRQLKKERLVAVLKLLNSFKIVLKEILDILELQAHEKM